MTGIIKTKKGGIDTIVAFIVVMIPITYVIIFMIATIYHFSVQQYLNQVVKEALVMASSYGDFTSGMKKYMDNKLEDVIGEDYLIDYNVKSLDGGGNVITTITFDEANMSHDTAAPDKLEKGDILGIYVRSNEPSVLNKISNISLFSGGVQSENDVYYMTYREEIIRNGTP